MCKFLSIITFIIFFYSAQAFTVIIASQVEVHLSVEDGDMQQGIIIDIKFNCKEVDISKKSFMHKKISKVFNVSPGQYEVEWTTEKSEKPWGGKKEIEKHHRTLVIELSDAVVYINVRGDTLTTY